jgi:hypothetical protein
VVTHQRRSTGKEQQMNHTCKHLITLGLAAIAMAGASAAAAAPAPQCDTFHFTGSTQQYAPDTPFVGGMSLTNLASGETLDVDVSTILLGYTNPAEGKAITSHEMTGRGYRGIDLVTFDDAQLVPAGEPGVFALISRLVVKTGSGVYNCGEMITDGSNSTVAFDAGGLGAANYSGLGRLCRCNPSD